jgi:hypothetical protein
VYGYDEIYGYCWYTTHNVSTQAVLLRLIMTWSLWLFIAITYLIIAVIMIIYSLCGKRGPLSGRTMSEYQKRHPSQVSSGSTDVNTALSTTMQRREMARRALTVRLLGYIMVPVICVFPGVITDIIKRARPDITFPWAVELITDITAGLMGTFNTILLSFDPSVVAVVFWPLWKKRREKKEKKMRERNKLVQRAQRPNPLATVPAPALTSTDNPPALGDPEMGGPLVSQYESQGMAYGLEFYGHLTVSEAADADTSVTSTIGYNADELAEIFRDL